MGAAEFVAHFLSLETDEPRLLAAEPEHVVMSRLDEGRVQVVENISHHITDSRVTFTSEDQAIDDLAADYLLRMVANITLPDGTLIGHALHQFKETGFGAGTLLFTTGGSSLEVLAGPPEFGNIAVATAALRAYVLKLTQVLTGTGVFAAHLPIFAWIRLRWPGNPGRHHRRALLGRLHQARGRRAPLRHPVTERARE